MRTATTITPGKVHVHNDDAPSRLTEYDRLKQRAARAHRERSYRSDGVTRCSKCPPRHCCPECASLNNARINAGLIHPKDDPTPHLNNIALQPMTGPFRGHRPIACPSRAAPVVTAYLHRLGGGWRRGVAMLNGQDVYVGKPTRSSTEAWAYAKRSADCIKVGLAYEDAVS